MPFYLMADVETVAHLVEVAVEQGQIRANREEAESLRDVLVAQLHSPQPRRGIVATALKALERIATIDGAVHLATQVALVVAKVM